MGGGLPVPCVAVCCCSYWIGSRGCSFFLNNSTANAHWCQCYKHVSHRNCLLFVRMWDSHRTQGLEGFLGGDDPPFIRWFNPFLPLLYPELLRQWQSRSTSTIGLQKLSKARNWIPSPAKTFLNLSPSAKRFLNLWTCLHSCLNFFWACASKKFTFTEFIQ